MSDRIVQSCHDGDGRAGQSMHSYQSVWMAHWTRTSCKEAPPDDNHVSLRLENKDDGNSNKHRLLSDLEIASDISPSVKEFTEVTEARTVRIVNDGLTNSKNMIDEQLDSQQFPMFRVSQNISSGLDSKNDLDISRHKQVSRPQIDCNVEYNDCTTAGHFPSVLAVAPPAIESSPREFQYEGVSLSPEGLVKSPKVVGDGSLALAGPQNNFIGSTQMVPYRSEKGKTPVSSSFMSRLVSKEHLSNSNFTTLEHEHDKYLGHPALLVCGKKVDNHSTSVKSGTSFLRQTNASQLLQDNYHLPMLVERCQKMQNCSSTGFFPSCSNPPEAMSASSIHDVETVRITNSVEGLAGDPGAFSQTTRSLLFMKKTDVNLSNENQTFRESRVSSKLNRNMFGELLTLSPPLAQNQQRLKLQPLGSSTECEEKDNVEGVETSEVCLKNESSAETDTMDTDAFKDHNYLSGISSSPSNKDFLMGQNPPSQPTITSTGVKVRHRWSMTELPDINEEILALPTTLNSMDNAEASTSRTQSLDAELLLSHTEHPSKAKSIPYPDDEPSNRWLKRLKLTASASDRFVLGTKSSNLGEAALSHEKVNKLFIKSLEGCKSSNSEPMVCKYHDKEKMATDQAAIVLRNGESSSVESTKKDRGILLSHPWIQRWCDNRAATRQKKVVCEPQSTKMEFDELRRKQFPSIAAMALMGKAMSGFQSCEFQRRGSFIVWNTKLF